MSLLFSCIIINGLQLKDFYKAASVVNPVVDMASKSYPFDNVVYLCHRPIGMSTTSDIPDWYVVCG